MSVLVVANSKGGVGKTTCAVFLALGLVRVGLEVVAVDCDRQESLSAWARLARDNGDPLPFEVCQGVDLGVVKGLGKWVVIDTSPGDSESIRQAVRVADLVVVPADSSPLDIHRVWPTVGLADELGVMSAVLMNRVNLRTSALRPVMHALEQGDAAVFDTVIPQREAIKQAMGTTPKELYGFDKAVKEIREALAQ